MDLSGPIAFLRNDDTVQIWKVERHLRLHKFRLHAVDSPPPGHVKDFYGIIAIDGGEHTVTFIIDSHVVETTWAVAVPAHPNNTTKPTPITSSCSSLVDVLK